MKTLTQLNFDRTEDRTQPWKYIVSETIKECSQVKEFTESVESFNKIVSYIVLAKSPAFRRWIERVISDGRDYTDVPIFAIVAAAPKQLVDLANSPSLPSFETVARALRESRSSKEIEFHGDYHHGQTTKTLW